MMEEVGKHLKRFMKDGTERDYGKVMHTEQVAHVTFYIIEGVEFYDGDDLFHSYDVYSESEKLGVNPVDGGFDYQQNNSGSYDDALTILRMEIQKLEEILERKRDGIPTQRQLFFLFRNKIPIPLTLTWGEASDLIDEKLTQIAKEKQIKRLERFKGFTEGDRVSYFSSWDKTSQLGRITKLYQVRGDTYVQIKMDDGRTFKTNYFADLQKIESELNHA